MNEQPDPEFVERLRREIRDAFGLEQMTPAEALEFEAYGRMVEALRADERAFIRATTEDGRRFAERLSEVTGLRIGFDVDPDDRLPRRRNPRIGCEEYPGGTWIHGRPHDCPKTARGFHHA